MTAAGGERVVPPALRERVLAAALVARAAGRCTPEVEQISPAEAFGRAADALHELLGTLDEGGWRLPVLRDLDVQGLVGHLIGVEADVQRCLTGDPSVAEADHVASTQPAADRQAGRPPDETRADWRRAVEETLGLVGGVEDLEAPVAIHGMLLPIGALLVVRAFELWNHDNDIRRVARLPRSVPDAATLRLMTELAAGLLPLGATRIGLEESIDVRVVLTGPGGGTWDVALGQGRPDPVRLRIVTDAVDFCRVVANRMTPDDLDLHVTGDRVRVGDVLAAAAALALD
ncbi:MAG TPA: maleylpyruvate isomerase family mycothiol-dependent enzyme [Kineosporiaceae bacterium]|jgi:uncharacterized protein (TIGR03083 family)|nr:maleylpyruvate isomerase family mycothiol-dependent enzyme [Kineosporiaceae bacterium]